MLWSLKWSGLWGGATAPPEAPDGVFASQDASGALAGLATDISGNATNITVGTNVVYETASTRSDLQTRTLDVVCSFSDTDTGYLFQRSDNRWILSAGGVLTLRVNSVLVLSYTIQNLTAATTENFVLSWATEPNPLTTGAADAYRSELLVHNVTLGTYEHATATHAVQATGSATMYWLAASTLGASAFTGTATKLRISSSFHSTTETYECYIAESSPTALGVTKLEMPLPKTSDVTLGDDGELDGPIRMFAGRALQENDLRLVGPVVNEIGSGSWSDDSPMTMVDPVSGTTNMHAEWLFRRPVPLHVNRVRIRAHVQQNDTASFSLTIKAYSSNRPGPVVTPSPSVGTDIVVYSNAVARVADDGTGATGGAWVDFGAVRVARDNEGYCYFWFGFKEAAASNEYRIRAVTIEPLIADTDGQAGGGIGFG